MAQVFGISIYGINRDATGTNNGSTMGFPSQHVLIRPVPTATTFNGVTVNSIIQLLPSGTKVGQDQYYSDRTVAQAITLANA